MRALRSFLRPKSAVLLLFMPLVSCISLVPRAANLIPAEGKLITAADIEESGATTAWEVLKHAGNHLSMRETARGEPKQLTYRGRSSLVASPSPLLYVDGTQISSFQYLRDIPARLILSIRLYNGVSGTKYYGTGGGNGVIVLLTKSAPGT